MEIVGLVVDLMDRSRISAVLPETKFASSAAAIRDAQIVIVDLSRGSENVGTVRATLANARIVAYGPHVDEVAMQTAKDAGANDVFPRSKFFKDVTAAVLGDPRDL